MNAIIFVQIWDKKESDLATAESIKILDLVH